MAVDKEKVLAITVEFRMGDRKVHTGRITQAYDQGVDCMIKAVSEAMPDGNLERVQAWMEWKYLYDRSTQVLIDGVPPIEDILVESDQEA